MKLIDYMRAKNLSDSAMAQRVGGISEHGIRKLKYGERDPSIATAIRINEATGGLVGLSDWAKLPSDKIALDREGAAA